MMPILHKNRHNQEPIKFLASHVKTSSCSRVPLACESSLFSSLFAADGVSRGSCNWNFLLLERGITMGGNAYGSGQFQRYLPCPAQGVDHFFFWKLQMPHSWARNVFQCPPWGRKKRHVFLKEAKKNPRKFAQCKLKTPLWTVLFVSFAL